MGLWGQRWALVAWLGLKVAAAMQQDIEVMLSSIGVAAESAANTTGCVF
jgi:hypothetical protein